MIDTPQLIAVIAVLWSATTGLAGLIYRDKNAQIARVELACKEARAEDAADLARERAEKAALQARLDGASAQIAKQAEQSSLIIEQVLPALRAYRGEVG